MVLKELCALRGVSGDEQRVRDFILSYVEPCAARVTVDRMGNLIAFKQGTGENRRHVLLSAHMDEVGMIVKGINENGLISYDAVGDIDPKCVVSKPVCIGEKEVPGVIGAKAIHLQTREERKVMLPHDQLYIDIGAKDQASAEALVELGDLISFESKWVEFGEGMVKSRALDGRIGCMVLMSLLEGDYPCDLTCVFTVQKEVGLRGGIASAYGTDADAILVLDGAPANDLGAGESSPKICALKEGVVLSFMDSMTVPALPLYVRLRALALENHIPWQMRKGVRGGSDAASFQRECGPHAVCMLEVPCRSIHSPSTVAAFADIEAVYRLADAFLAAGGTF